MKKYLFLGLLLCLGRVGIIHAENTDISTIDNVVYIQSLTAQPGTRVNLSICMKNSAQIRGFQFNLYLPDGVTAAKNNKGRIISELTTERLEDDDEHTLTLAEQNDGSILFLCGSQYDEVFKGTDGEIATLTVDIAADMPNGNYPIQLKAIELTETNIDNYYDTDLVESTLTIGEVEKDYTILDETSTTVPEASSDAVDILVKRTIKANEWSTLCLPFDMTEEQVYEAFGQDVQLAEFVDYEAEYDDEDNVIGIQVNFDPTDLSEGLYANYPYMIKISEMITEFTTNSTIDPDEEGILAEYDNGLTGKRRKVYGSFIGTYHAQTTVPENGLFLSDNKFWYSTGNTKMKAFRAYFTFVDVLTSVEESGAKVNMNMVVGDATGINTVDHTARNNDGKVYNLQGQRVGKNFKGIVIENGRKVLK